MPDARPLFVVQLHHASSLHFDLRLEIDGVLASWAVPKGPSLDPREKRLAVQVGDHEMGHADVEGLVGTGTVIVWDRGRWDNATRRDGEPAAAAAAVAAGHLRFVLDGRRLVGGFALTRTRMGGQDRNWLLVKIDDEYADRDRRVSETERTSVLTGRTNDDLRPGASGPDASGGSTSPPPSRPG